MKKLKVSEIAAVNAALKAANMNKGDVSAKLALVDAIMATKSVADGYNDLVSVTREKLQPEDFAEMQHRAQKKDLTQREIVELNRYFFEYEKSVEDAVKDEADKEVEVNIKPWTNEQFTALLESNSGYTGAHMVMLYEILTQ